MPVKNLRQANALFLERDHLAGQVRLLHQANTELDALGDIFRNRAAHATKAGDNVKLAYFKQVEANVVLNKTLDNLQVKQKRTNLVVYCLASGLFITLLTLFIVT